MILCNVHSLAVTMLLLGKFFPPSGRDENTSLTPALPSTTTPTAIPMAFQEEITVMSWNILAPCYVLPHLHRSRKFADDFDSVTEYMDWSYRRPRIIERITRESADIVCLQEVQLDLWVYLRDELKERGYTASIVQKVNRGLRVTTVILVHDRRQYQWKVTKVESRSRVLLVTLECQPSTSCGTSSNSKNTEPYFIFLGNVHLSAGRKEFVTRYQQVKSMLQRLVLHTQRSSPPQLDEPFVLLMGDWNTLSTDPLHHLITTGTLPEDHGLPQLYPNLPLLPLHDINQSQEQKQSNGLNWTHTCGEILDYIFASSSVRVVSVWSTNHGTNLPIPSADFPSDHVPIGGKLQLSRINQRQRSGH